jgi:hypothetical protein
VEPKLPAVSLEKLGLMEKELQFKMGFLAAVSNFEKSKGMTAVAGNVKSTTAY